MTIHFHFILYSWEKIPDKAREGAMKRGKGRQTDTGRQTNRHTARDTETEERKITHTQNKTKFYHTIAHKDQPI